MKIFHHMRVCECHRWCKSGPRKTLGHLSLISGNSSFYPIAQARSSEDTCDWLPLSPPYPQIASLVAISQEYLRSTHCHLSTLPQGPCNGLWLPVSTEPSSSSLPTKPSDLTSSSANQILPLRCWHLAGTSLWLDIKSSPFAYSWSGLCPQTTCSTWTGTSLSLQHIPGSLEHTGGPHKYLLGEGNTLHYCGKGKETLFS